MMFRYFCCLTVLAVLPSSADDITSGKTLVMAFLVVKHCEQTPSKEELSLASKQTRAEIAKLTSLEGPEALTMAGKRRAYELGHFLHQRYGAGKLVRNMYHPQDIYIRTGIQDSTKMTAQIAMAAMYPPEGGQIWNDELGRVWQPIPYSNGNKNKDFLNFYAEVDFFAYYHRRLWKLLAKTAHHEFQAFKDLLPILKEHTERNFSREPLLYKTYMDLLRIQKHLKVGLPKRIKDIFPRLEEAAQLVYRCYFYNDDLVKNGAGLMWHSILNTIENATEGKPARKLILHSAHDINIGISMKISKVEGKPKIPDYGAVFGLELYKDKGGDDHYVLPIYLAQAGGQAQLEYLKIEGCGTEPFCEFSKFKSLTKDNTLTERQMMEFTK